MTASGSLHMKRKAESVCFPEMKKTERKTSKPIPLEAGLADVLTQWRAECAYNQPEDYVFATVEMDGKQRLWPTSAMEKHIRPAAIRAKVQTVGLAFAPSYLRYID